ncbi:ALCAM [Mytilus coruscus]|uniref:ALCAM n=1 Tax=Mytilus coruscus TaxID=42192 RepID=A0A6J8DI04_MYTCO|nr:ALCAM [Mytilus coruscus]
MIDVHTFHVEIKGNVARLNGGNGTEIECSYTKQNYILITVVSFLAFNRSSVTSNEIAIYVPNSLSYLTDNGQYLKGRVTLMNITQSTTKAVIKFNKLMCMDETLYQCRVNVISSSGVKNTISNSTTISVQVPPPKPDRVSIVHAPANSSLTSTKTMVYSTSLPSTAVTSSETETLTSVQIAKQNDTTTLNYSPVPNTHFDTKFSTLSNADLSSDISNKSTTFYTDQKTTIQGIAEGDNITVVCKGDVGKPPAQHVFQKYHNGHILSITYTATETSISQISENCSYYRTSNLTFQVTAQDSNAVIRCAVDSPVAQYDNLYLETAPIKVNCTVFGGVSGAVVFMIVIIIVRAIRTKKTSETPISKNESKRFLGSRLKPFAESKTGNYDIIAGEKDDYITQTVNNEHEVDDDRDHKKKYLKIQEEEETKKNESYV